MKDKLLIAHRGAERIISENTIESILLAFKYGATHAEIDIRKTKDGKLVLFHDPITFRFDRRISFVSHTEMKYLEKLPLPKGGKITTLDNLLATMENTPGNLLIETKTLGLEEGIIKLVDKYNFWNRVIVWSLYERSIKIFTQLCGKKIKKAIFITLWPILEKNILNKALKCGADFVYPVFRNLNIKFFEQNGIGVIKRYKKENNARDFLEQGGAGIMTSNLSIIQNLAKDYNQNFTSFSPPIGK